MKIVIVGAGEVGFHIASRLAYEHKDVVVVDKDPTALKRVSESIDVQVVEGSGSSPSVLKEAGIKAADILLAVTDSDEANLVACMVASILSPSTKKMARIRSSDYDNYHDHFKENAPYIDTIINPEIEVVNTIYRLMKVPGSIDVGEFAGGRLKFIGMRLDSQSMLSGMRLTDLPSASGNGRLLIAAIVRDDEVIVPRGSDRLKTGDLVYFISEEESTAHILKLFGKKANPLRRVMIVGGGSVGARLASLLEKKSIQTRVIEKDADRCRVLADRMNKAIILHGDGSDQGLLAEESIKEMDVVVTLTNDEETNILVSLLARNMGAATTITKISKFGYLPLMGAIGIDQVVSPRLSAIDSILQHIRKGKVLSALSVHGEQAEVIEAVALETSEIVGKPISKVAFPKGSLLIGIIRGESIMVPSGSNVIEPDDRVIIFATREAVPKIEKILTVKLEFF